MSSIKSPFFFSVKREKYFNYFMWLNEDTVSTLQEFLCTTNLQDVVFLAKFSFILRGYNCFGCDSAALRTPIR